jgi:hypothetical protein
METIKTKTRQLAPEPNWAVLTKLFQASINKEIEEQKKLEQTITVK